VDTNTLNHAMREATEDLSPAPDFASRVMRRGRRRALWSRVRAVTVAGAVLVSAGGIAVVVWPGGTEPSVVADWRLNQPTGGDLAGDATVLDDAVRAWRDGLRYLDGGDGVATALRGEPHVYWAGTTPGGRAAVVLQATAAHDSEAVVGVVAVDPASAEFRLVGDRDPADGPRWAYAFGPGDRTVLALDDGESMYFSPSSKTASDGVVTRDWQRMDVTDGVALAQVPQGGDPEDIRILARQVQPAPRERDSTGLRPLWRASEYVARVDSLRTGEPYSLHVDYTPRGMLSWRESGPGGVTRVGPPVQIGGDAKSLFGQAVNASAYVDMTAGIMGLSEWFVAAGLPDGRTALLGEFIQDLNDAELFAVLLDSGGAVIEVLPGGAVNSQEAVPVRMRMPVGQGWVVAAYGSSLAYRTSSGGAWIGAGKDAALLPDTATEVRAGTAVIPL
jgi:hypothetical protein